MSPAFPAVINLAAADPIADWIAETMQTLGAPGAGLLIALENLFPPLPSEAILPLAGFAASQGAMNLLSAIAWTTLGSVVGALVLYRLGVALGYNRVVAIAAKIPLVRASDIETTAAWFDRHGVKAVFFGRMIPLFRSLISVPAGVQHMGMGPFVALTVAGSLVWNTALILAGYFLGANWAVVQVYIDDASKVVLVVVLLATGYFVSSRLVRMLR